VVTLLAHPCGAHTTLPLQQTAWYTKTAPTFADALALVRRHVWASLLFQTSSLATEVEIIRGALLDHLCDLLCYAA